MAQTKQHVTRVSGVFEPLSSGVFIKIKGRYFIFLKINHFIKKYVLKPLGWKKRLL